MAVSREGMALPRSLAGQSAELIRAQIEAGVLGPVLPGESALAGMLDVSRPTVRAALVLLENDGVVQAAEQGKPRVVKRGWFGEWLESKEVPCVCFGGSYRNRLPRTGGDGDGAIRSAVRSLLELGHRRIVYPLHNTYGVQMVAPFREVMEEFGVEWNESFHVPRWKDHATNWFPLLERMFAAAKPPTAFLTLGVSNLLPVLTWLGHHGLRVPEDVSIINMLDDPLLEFLYPPVTGYRLDRDKLCHAAVDLVLRVAQAGKPFDLERMIPLCRVEGHSTGPPRRA